jgi:molybdopterin-containing oxidoreductase family membrane subunit
MTGPYAVQYWSLVSCNVIAPNLLWFKRLRSSPVFLFCSSIVVLIGMWLERYIIIASSLAQDFLNSSWRVFEPTRWDWGTYFGTIGLFLVLFFIFIRLLPMISIFEVRLLLPSAKVKEEAQR